MTLTNQPRPTLTEAIAMLAAHGYTPSTALSWESESHVYAFSKESVPGTYGSPAGTVCWHHGYLDLPQQR